MKLIAKQTVQTTKTLRARDPKIPKDRGDHEYITAEPGDEFEVESAEEAERLIKLGAAEKKGRSADDGEKVAVTTHARR